MILGLKERLSSMENEQTKLRHSKVMELLDWGGCMLFGLLAVFYYNFGNMITVIFLALPAVFMASRLMRLYKARFQNPYALILNEKYIHAPSELLSKYAYPIPWRDIKSVMGTIDKNKREAKYLLLELHDRERTLGEVTKSQTRLARKLSKKYFIAQSYDDNQDFKSGEAIEKNYQYFLNSILLDFEYIADKEGQLLEKLEYYSNGRFSTLRPSQNEFGAHQTS